MSTLHVPVFRQFGRLSVAVLAAISLAHICQAQTNPAPTSSPLAGSTEGALQEIVVTARKRQESIQSVPASIEALSGEELAERGILSLNDLAAAVPGVNLNSYEPDRAVISIRGITSSSESPTVGFYLDDVTISSRSAGFSGQAEPAMLDMQRVEVLKGPQGTLYGASSMGGAIKFVSNQPSKEGLDLTISGGTAAVHGGAESYDGEFVANVPLIDNVVSLRVGSLYDFQAGYIDRVPAATGLITLTPNEVFQSFNASSDRNINSHQTVATRVALGWWPDDTLSAVLDLRYQDRRSKDFGSFWVNLPRFQQSDVLPQPIDDRLTMPTLTITQSLGAFDLISISAYVDRRRSETTDYTFYVGTLVPPFAASASPSTVVSPTNTLSQEIRVASTDPSARAQVVAGVYFQRESYDWNQDVFTDGSGVTSAGVPADEVFLGRTDSVLKQTAVFGELTYSVNDFVDLTVGGREFHIAQNFERIANGLFNGGLTMDSSDSSETGFTPKFEITGKFDREHLVYALVDKGFRPGAVNATVPTSLCAADLAALGITSAPSGYKSDSLWNYEIGTKNTFSEQRLLLNGALFYLDWKNIQQTVNLPSCGFSFTGNVGAAAVKGADFDTRWEPLTGFTLSLAGTYADAYITKSAPGTQGDVGDPVLVSPKWVLNGGMEYSFNTFSGWPSFARLDYQWHGSQTQNFIRTITTSADPGTGASFGGPRTVANPGYLQQSYNQLNASVGLKAPRWSTRVYVENVTNTHPLLNLTNIASGGLQTTAYTLAPRTIGLSVSTNFR